MVAIANFIEKRLPFLLESNETSNIGISELPRSFFQNYLSPFTERFLSIVCRRPTRAEPGPSHMQEPCAQSSSIATPAEDAPVQGDERERVMRDLCLDSEDYLRASASKF